MLTILCCAKENSKRLPGKNWMQLNGKPLIQYTFETMTYLRRELKLDCVVVTDSQICADLAKENDIPVLIDVMVDKGMKFNRWVHSKINADSYVILQPTNPLRDNKKVLKWINYCILNKISSGFSVYRKDRLNYVMNGNFFYYHHSQLYCQDLVDSNSAIFQDDRMLDINTKEDFEKAKEIYEN